MFVFSALVVGWGHCVKRWVDIGNDESLVSTEDCQWDGQCSAYGHLCVFISFTFITFWYNFYYLNASIAKYCQWPQIFSCKDHRVTRYDGVLTVVGPSYLQVDTVQGFQRRAQKDSCGDRFSWKGNRHWACQHCDQLWHARFCWHLLTQSELNFL